MGGSGVVIAPAKCARRTCAPWITSPAISITAIGGRCSRGPNRTRLTRKILLTYCGPVAAPGAPPVMDVYGALAHPIRREIVAVLASGDKGVRELADPLPVSRPAVSQ